MPPLEEPSVSEMLRTLGAQLTQQGAQLGRMEQALGLYVTQDQRTADQLLAAEREGRQNEKITALEAAQANKTRVLVSSVIAPIVVAIVVWLITRGSV